MMQPTSYQRMPGAGGGGTPGSTNNTAPFDFNNTNNISPGTLANSEYWQQQQKLSQLSRSTNSPHSYARSAAVNSRSQQQQSTVLTVLELAEKFVKDMEEKQHTNAAAAAANAVTSGMGTPVKGSAKITNGMMPNPKQKREQAEEERTRRINEDINKQFWTAIDLSGQGIMNISLKLFHYSFLQKLYLSHNKLMSVPKEIKNLKQLKVLDLSDNQLTSLPDELGLMFTLKYLFLFDNKLTSLPYDFGYLFQLEVLGIDGNPLPDSMKEIMAREGTRGVIIDLREKGPVKYQAPTREWMVYDDEPTEHNFTVMTYNTLCDKYATAQMYGYTPSWALSWDYRCQLLKGQILNHGADILCLQEVDANSFEKFWCPELAKEGYKGLHWQKTRARTMGENEGKKVDGCATFYKTDKFKLVEKHSLEYNSLALRKDDFKKTADIYNRVMNKDEIALVLVFEHLVSGDLVVVGNTHVQWNPEFKDVKLVQTALLLEDIERLVSKYAAKDGEGAKYPKYTDPKSIPMVLCCDLNSTTDSGVCQLLSTGKVAPNHSDLEGRVYGRYTEQGMEHNFSLKSAYSEIGELPFTNYTPNFVDAIDYIYISGNNLGVKGLLGEIGREYANHYVGFPNAHLPSDHIPLMTELGFKKKAPEKAKLPPPNFGNFGKK